MYVGSYIVEDICSRAASEAGPPIHADNTAARLVFGSNVKHLCRWYVVECIVQ